jgi:hypothetical protein
MQLTKYIILFTVLILTILVTRSSNAETTCTENSLGDQTCVTTTTTNVPGVTTDNLLSPNFQDGSWNYSSNMTFHGSNTLATTHNSSADSTVSLSTDGGLTKSQINSGFTSTFGLDIWFWSGSTSNVTMKQTLTDDNGNVITQQRVISGTNNTYGTNYTDTITVNANTKSDYSIKAELSNTTPAYTTGHYGPDINDPSLVVTTNSTTSTSISETFLYCYERVPNACTYDNKALEDIADFKTDDGKSYDQYVEDAIKDFEVVSVDTSIIVEDDFGKIEEFKIEDYAVETFDKFISSNDLTETFETALVEEDLTKEEFYDTMANEIKEEFETELGGSNDLTTDAKSEDFNTETETNLEEANADTTTTKETTEIDTETNTESETTETNSTESDVVENKETEGSETETNTKETVDAKETGDVKTDSGKTVDNSSIEKKVERVIAKVISKLKDVDKKLQAIQYITTKGITAGEADISGYINKRVYNTQQQIPDAPFYSNLNILEQQQIYSDVSLTQYTSNDLIGKQQNALLDVEQEINRIQSELYALKQKRG